MKKLFKVNDDYVVANNYQEAIEIWLQYHDISYKDEKYIKSVELVKDEVIVVY